MPAFTASAPGKIILFGEHAVVYGRPAIAAPVTEVQARAVVTANPKRADSGAVASSAVAFNGAAFSGAAFRIIAPEIDLDDRLDALPPEHPLRAVIQSVCDTLEVSQPPAFTLKVTSTIPVAAGLGSGAAVAVAIIRAFSSFLGHPLPDEQVNALAFEAEKILHGSPSGIDNTVVTYSQPVFFIKGQPTSRLSVRRAFTIVIGDTGVTSPTRESVGDLRRAWQTDPTHFEAMFESAGAIAQSARRAIEDGAIELLGPLMDANHGILRKMGVSCNELDNLVLVARQSGAWGAKLSGGGRGGNMIALAAPERAESIARSLLAAGARRVIVTEVAPSQAHAKKGRRGSNSSSWAVR